MWILQLYLNSNQRIFLNRETGGPLRGPWVAQGGQSQKSHKWFPMQETWAIFSYPCRMVDTCKGRKWGCQGAMGQKKLETDVQCAVPFQNAPCKGRRNGWWEQRHSHLSTCQVLSSSHLVTVKYTVTKLFMLGSQSYKTHPTVPSPHAFPFISDSRFPPATTCESHVFHFALATRKQELKSQLNSSSKALWPFLCLATCELLFLGSSLAFALIYVS